MSKLTLQLKTSSKSWQDVATISFKNSNDIQIEYDIDYVFKYFNQHDFHALSICYPVTAQIYQSHIPGFILDMIPQGEQLRRLLRKYNIAREDQFFEILSQVPLSACGNIRIKEAWLEFDKLQKNYLHPGFSLNEIIKYQKNFVDYMEEHGAPIGGTSGVGGGSPKFLLRQDQLGKFHAEGILPDKKTKKSFIIKFPFTDSSNSELISITEKKYYDVLRKLPIQTYQEIKSHENVLFISRFDRQIEKIGSLRYYGLESLYSAHDIHIYGTRLFHEQNLNLIQKYSTSPKEDILEYIKRDLINQILSNTDNHGRNTSFIKHKNMIRLSPIYDVTAMKFFTGDFIIELTHWQDEHFELDERLKWVSKNYLIPLKIILQNLEKFFHGVKNIVHLLKEAKVAKEIIDKTSDDRENTLSKIKNYLTKVHSKNARS